MSSIKRLQRELEQINKSEEVGKYGISAGPINDEDWYNWQGTIMGPKDSPYEGGIFFLNIEFKHEYPFKPPKIKFVTKIFHVNIHYDGTICCDSFSLLNDMWNPNITVLQTLLSIQSLLRDPNFDTCNLYGYGVNLQLMPHYYDDDDNYEDDRILYYKIANEWNRKYAGGSYNKYYYDAKTYFNKKKIKLSEEIHQIISNFESKLDELDKFIIKFVEYINTNKIKINEIKKKINNLKEELIELKNKNSNDSYNEIMNLKSEKRSLKYEKQLISHIESNIPLLIKEKLITISIISTDENIHFSIICQKNDNFSEIEKLLYNKYPNYKNNNNYFVLDGNIIDQKKNLENNNIKDNDIIILNIK